MSPISSADPPSSFAACQLCGHASDDICAFRMWQRCDDADEPIDDFIIVCNQQACQQRIEDDAMLFIEVPWSRGGPGKFMLLCGDCPHRKGWSCQHPNLTANGGNGLEVQFSGLPILNMMICGSDGCHRSSPPAIACVGNPDARS